MDWSTLLKAVEVILGGAVGGTAAVLGLSRWLGDVWLGQMLEKEKAKYAKEIEQLKARFAQEIERYRAQLDRSIFVTRVHFETEFEAHKAVFAKLAEMRLRLGGLRPSMNIVPANDTTAAKLERLHQSVRNAQEGYNELITTSENLSPFYPPEIHEQIRECQRITSLEISDILTSSQDQFSFQWFGRGRQNLDQFMVAYNNVSTLIRERISKLALTPSA
jgi:hypothetical protein